MIKIKTPLTDEVIKKLKIGDRVLLSGVIYTARDTAHQKLVDLLLNKKPLPFEPAGSVLFYVGPTPRKPPNVIGSAGPTTSYRMDSFTPQLLSAGVKGMVGKGKRTKEVIESIKKNIAVYFGATGGAGALLSKSIISAEVIAFKDLGPEAVRKLKVLDMPLIVVNDAKGNDLYDEGQKKFRIQK